MDPLDWEAYTGEEEARRTSSDSGSVSSWREDSPTNVVADSSVLCSVTSVDEGIRWGPVYDEDTCRFTPGSTVANKFYRDEIWDMLVGELTEGPVYPVRLRDRYCGDKSRRVLKEFRKNANRSWRVERDKEDGEFVLLHEVKEGKSRDAVGVRRAKLGWKIVPKKEHILPIITQVCPPILLVPNKQHSGILLVLQK